MSDNFLKRMNNAFNQTSSKVSKDDTKPATKKRKPAKHAVKHSHVKHISKKGNQKKSNKSKNSPLKVTNVQVKDKHVKSNNKTGHVLLTPIMVDVRQVAQIDTLKRMLHLKNRAQALQILMNKRQTVSDVVAKLQKQNPKAKKLFAMRCEFFLDDHEPKVINNYRKYHSAKK